MKLVPGRLSRPTKPSACNSEPGLTSLAELFNVQALLVQRFRRPSAATIKSLRLTLAASIRGEGLAEEIKTSSNITLKIFEKIEKKDRRVAKDRFTLD